MMHTRTRTSKRSRTGLQLVLLTVMVAGCVARSAVTPISTLPLTPTATAVSPSTLETMSTDAAGHLISQRAASPPVLDGQVDAVWATAEPLRLSLTWGLGGTVHALDVELRALHTGEAVYFLAQWPGEPPSGEEDTVFNKFTMHWRIPEPEGAVQGLDCTVACHTAFADGRGRFVYANAETIPQGGNEALPAAGVWRDGTWTLEWGRPLVNSNPFDLQFVDLDQAYLFLVKIFERVEGRPDPVSERNLLVFQP
jgi:hypothetical protein